MTRPESAFETFRREREETCHSSRSVTCPGIRTCAWPLHRNDSSACRPFHGGDKCPFSRQSSTRVVAPIYPRPRAVIGQGETRFDIQRETREFVSSLLSSLFSFSLVIECTCAGCKINEIDGSNVRIIIF